MNMIVAVVVITVIIRTNAFLVIVVVVAIATAIAIVIVGVVGRQHIYRYIIPPRRHNGNDTHSTKKKLPHINPASMV